VQLGHTRIVANVVVDDVDRASDPVRAKRRRSVVLGLAGHVDHRNEPWRSTAMCFEIKAQEKTGTTAHTTRSRFMPAR